MRPAADNEPDKGSKVIGIEVGEESMTNASKDLAFGSGASAEAKQVADAFINVRTWAVESDDQAFSIDAVLPPILLCVRLKVQQVPYVAMNITSGGRSVHQSASSL